jgi:hypothetical protein
MVGDDDALGVLPYLQRIDERVEPTIEPVPVKIVLDRLCMMISPSLAG